MNYISKIAAFLIAVILLFIVPSYRMYWIIDQAVLKAVNSDTQEFVNTLRHKGYISKQQFEYFINQLSKTGNIYDVQIVHTKKAYYPLKPGDPGYSTTHTYTIVDDIYSTKQVLDTLYTSNKDYQMKKGDYIKVMVTNKSRTGAMVFLNFMNGSSASSMIFGQFGGMIANEDY